MKTAPVWADGASTTSPALARFRKEEEDSSEASPVVNQRILRAFELFARLLGVGLVVAGLLVASSAPLYGAPLVAVGLLFALRPSVAAELLDLVASLF